MLSSNADFYAWLNQTIVGSLFQVYRRPELSFSASTMAAT